MPFDFLEATPPDMSALGASFAATDIEAELKQLFIDLFTSLFGIDTYNANVLGAGHLATETMINKAVNLDGLVPLKAAANEAALRYLYRAWKSKGNEGRGLAFLRTYLQLVFPNECTVEQLWHARSRSYPDNVFLAGEKWYWRHMVGEWGLKLDGSWKLGEWIEGHNTRTDMRAHLVGEQGLKVDGTWRVGERFAIVVNELEEKAFLTSRIMISFDYSALTVENLAAVVRSVLPARLVPVFRARVLFDQAITPTFSGSEIVTTGGSTTSTEAGTFPLVSATLSGVMNEVLDANAQFHDTAGTNSGVWTYGYKATQAAALVAYDVLETDANYLRWTTPTQEAETPNVLKNIGASSLYTVPPGKSSLHPGTTGTQEFSTVRFTAPVAGTWTANVAIYSGDTGGVQAILQVNGVEIANVTDSSSKVYLANDIDLTLSAGDTVDLMVGAAGAYQYDTTPFDFTMTNITT